MAKETKKMGITINNSYKYFDGYDDTAMSGSSIVPDTIMPYIDRKVRAEMNYHNQLKLEEGKYDKASSQHMYIQKEEEKVGRAIININNQTQKFKYGISETKRSLGTMNPGTDPYDLFANTAVYSGQAPLYIDNDGNFNFLLDEVEITEERNKAVGKFIETGEWNEDGGEVVTLNDMAGRSIIQEPYVTKAFVFKLADKTKNDKDSGKQFDEKWTYNSSLNNFNEAGPKDTIGAAFADLAGDGITKSFAEMYEEGMNPEYYIDPETGQALPRGIDWMRDTANAKLLARLLSKYLTNVMKDIHTPTIDEDTGQIKKSKSQLAQELIEKYSK